MTMTLLGHTRSGVMRRSVPPGSVRAVEVNGRPVIQLQVVKYNVLDSYKTVFLPGCVDKSFLKRKPQLCLNHSWDIENVVGRAFQIVENDPSKGPIVDHYLANFDYVPNARMVYSQVMDEILDECSVGFDFNYQWRSPTDEERDRFPGVQEMIEEIDWTETSIVLRGAVPESKVTGFRTKQRSAPLTRSHKWIEEETAAQIVLKLASPDSQFSLADAFNALRDNAIEHPGDPNEKTDEKTDEPETPQSDDAAESESDSGQNDDEVTHDDEQTDEGTSTDEEMADVETSEKEEIGTDSDPAEIAAKAQLDADAEAALALIGGK